MIYAYDLENGQELIVRNDGDNTLVALSASDEGQQQMQSTGFSTGKWLKPPELFRVRGNLVLRLETKGGVDFVRVRGSQIQLMRSDPGLENAEKLKLKKSTERLAMTAMEPLEPMKPMRGMRPMEMRMGDMHMSMGSTEKTPQEAQRFCTQCGERVEEGDRFCANCGHSLSGRK